jgi:hypothetical protein
MKALRKKKKRAAQAAEALMQIEREEAKKVKGAGSGEDLTVLIKGENAFGTTVSKSFERIGPNGNREVDTVNISVAGYRVVEVCLSMFDLKCWVYFSAVASN